MEQIECSRHFDAWKNRVFGNIFGHPLATFERILLGDRALAPPLNPPLILYKLVKTTVRNKYQFIFQATCFFSEIRKAKKRKNIQFRELEVII